MNGKKRKLPAWAVEDEPVDVPVSSGGEAAIHDAPDLKNDTQQSLQSKDDEDDYLNMKFDESASHAMSLMGKRERLLLNHQSGHKQPSKPDTSLSIDPTDVPGQPASKAMKMMQRMGYVSGQALGTDGKGIVEPLRAPETVTRSGLGLEAQKRREVVERIEKAAKQVQEEQTEYRETVRTEIEEKRIEGRIHAAQKVCETLDTRQSEEQALDDADNTTRPHESTAVPEPKTVNVLWRSLVVYRKEKERQRALRQQMLDASMSFSQREYNEDHPRPSLAEAASTLRRTVYEEEGEDEDDEELEQFEALDSLERLQRVLDYLRKQHRYCFWCGCQYTDDDDLKNCPGESEADHE
ncbi:protein of unknown function [Taphrina deformans PYCC 5710]|uniref:G-patch domain-containing protein n=1 Tax=Taphrina deformans (strain PYCC 5710 / ATCC 11124 / CBS 356.35 / IMI 108563 / JCM 9778 / NBRC 8474) TaxID=1097556 RepID=R4XEE8_TAPDE|nr:protein of unknown function [Taphrina deformans PYCC 5710]|eukprot:CCG84212.1 protein of unknown function [Taphrina deformans PYCC 5710]